MSDGKGTRGLAVFAICGKLFSLCEKKIAETRPLKIPPHRKWSVKTR